MSIVNSSYDLHPAQSDGRRYVTEKHTDSTGKVHEVFYLAASGEDYAAVMAVRAVQIAQQLADAEAAALMA